MTKKTENIDMSGAYVDVIDITGPVTSVIPDDKPMTPEERWIARERISPSPRIEEDTFSEGQKVPTWGSESSDFEETNDE